MSYPAIRKPLPPPQMPRFGGKKEDPKRGTTSKSRRNPPSAIPSAQKQQTVDLSHKAGSEAPLLTSLPAEWSGGEEQPQIRKLDLSGQEQLGPKLHAIRFLGDSLTWLNLNGVKCVDENGKDLVMWTFLKMCRTLFVLNISHSLLSSIPKELASVPSLKALVLSHNTITSPSLSVLSTLTSLNSLILSDNALTSFPSTLTTSLPQLKKLSLANNSLSSDGLPDFSGLSAVEELRLNGNAAITRIPDGFDKLDKMTILELSNTGLSHWSEVEKLKDCKGLVNLGLKGTPLAKEAGDDKDAYTSKVISFLPNLRILDNQRFDPRYLQLKENEKKRKEAAPASSASTAKRGKDRDGGKPKRLLQQSTDKKEKMSDVKKGKRKAEPQEEQPAEGETVKKASKKRKSAEDEEEPAVYDDDAAVSLTTLPRDPSEPKKKRSRYRKRLEKAAALAAGLSVDGPSVAEKKAKSIGGSLGGPAEVTQSKKAEEADAEGPKTLDELVKTRAGVIGVVEVKPKHTTAVASGRKGRQEVTAAPEKQPSAANDVFSVLFAKEAESTKPASGWD